MAPKMGAIKLRKRQASGASEHVPAWLKAVEGRLEAKFDSLESRLQASLEDLSSSKAEIFATLESKVASLQGEIQQRNGRARAPLLRYYENMKQYDVFNQLEDCFLDLESRLQSLKSLDATARGIVDRGKALISNRKNIICIRDREGPRVAEFFEMGDFTLLENCPKIGLDGSVVTLS